jgi:membrane protease YdiL (CAAX protease family)
MNASNGSKQHSWQTRPITQILAVVVVYVPLYVFALWTSLSGRTVTLEQLFLYPLLFGGGGVVLILLTFRFVCGERLANIQLKPGKWYTDIAAGVLLGVLALGIKVLQGVVQSTMMPASSGPASEEVITLFSGIAHNPLLIALWLGPVVWIGVAGFEELTRVFMLNRLWRIWPQPLAVWLVLVLSAALFGLVHIYQDPLSMVFIFIQGVVYALYYRQFGRLWPLIIAHAIYDSLQVIQVVMVFRGI